MSNDGSGWRETLSDIMSDEPPIVKQMVELIRGTGAFSMQLRQTGEDLDPQVWIVVVTHYFENMMPVDHRAGDPFYTVAAAIEMWKALHKIAEELIDGGGCMNCHQQTALVLDELELQQSFGKLGICVIYWDDERERFARQCDERAVPTA